MSEQQLADNVVGVAPGGSPGNSEGGSDDADAGSNNNSNRTEGSMTLGTQSTPEKITLSDIHEDLTTLTAEMRQLATETRQLVTETRAASERAEA